MSCDQTIHSMSFICRRYVAYRPDTRVHAADAQCLYRVLQEVLPTIQCKQDEDYGFR